MITVIGIDAAMAHMGLCRATINPHTLKVNVIGLQLVATSREDKKTVRKSSDDLRRAQHLMQSMNAFCDGAMVAFAEVPSGSLSATAARALGIAVGVLAGCSVPIIEVSQQEVKMHTVGKKTATKEEMIAWATSRWPAAPWLTRKSKGQIVLMNDNEHLADACATIAAGIRTPAFKQAAAMLASQLPAAPTGRTQIVWKP